MAQHLRLNVYIKTLQFFEKYQYTSFCDEDYLNNIKTELFKLFDEAMKDAKINDFTDNYSPLLEKLKEKYTKEKETYSSLNKNYENELKEFNEKKTEFLADINTQITAFEEAINSLNYITKYKFLELQSDLVESFRDLKEKVLPKLNYDSLVKSIRDFNGLSKYNTEDNFLISIDAEVGSADEEGEKLVKAKFEHFLNYVSDINITDSRTIIEEDLILTLKQIKTYASYAKEIVEKKEFVGLKKDVSMEIELQIDEMNLFLRDKTPMNINTFMLNPNAKATPTTSDDNVENESKYDIWHFKKHYSNLSDSLAYVCYIIRNNAFNRLK